MELVNLCSISGIYRFATDGFKKQKPISQAKGLAERLTFYGLWAFGATAWRNILPSSPDTAALCLNLVPRWCQIWCQFYGSHIPITL